VRFGTTNDPCYGISGFVVVHTASADVVVAIIIVVVFYRVIGNEECPKCCSYQRNGDSAT
jgi:hypothetical protein